MIDVKTARRPGFGSVEPTEEAPREVKPPEAPDDTAIERLLDRFREEAAARAERQRERAEFDLD